MNTTAIVWIPDGEPGWPFETVAGLPLVERSLKALSFVGVERVHLCCDPGTLADIEGHLARRAEDPRLPEVELHPGCNQPSFQLEVSAVALDGRCVYHLGLLRDAVTQEPAISYRLAGDRPAGIGVLAAGTTPHPGSLDGLAATPVPDGCFVQRADTAPDREQAERLLFKSLSKPVDGWFSVHLNRRVSTRVSKVLARLPVSPNLFTVVSYFVVGVPAAILSAHGSYLGFALGGLLFQLYSILDGVDGELARVKFMQSRTGEWLDSIADNTSNILYLAGVTIGVYRSTGSELLLWLGIAATGLATLEVIISFWDLLAYTGSATKLDFAWEFKQPGKRDKASSRLLLLLEPFTRQDFYSLFFMVLALAGAAWLILPITTVTFCVIFFVKMPQLVRRRFRTRPVQ